MISALVSAGITGCYLTNARLKQVHWQAGDRPLPPPPVTVAGESLLLVDPGQIPAPGLAGPSSCCGHNPGRAEPGLCRAASAANAAATAATGTHPIWRMRSAVPWWSDERWRATAAAQILVVLVGRPAERARVGS